MIKLFRFILMTFFALLFAQTVVAKNQPQSLDGIVAVVNDSAVTQSEINEATKAITAQFNGSNTPLPSADVLQKKVLEQVIDRKLQLQAAEQAGIKISETQIDQTIANIAKENGVTTDVLYEKVASQDLTRAEYRKEIREELTLQQIQQQQVGSKINMTPEEVKNFMHSAEWRAATANLSAPSEKDAQQMVYQRKFAATLKKWIAQLRSQAVINMHPNSPA